jgi:CRP-like cAMP-binding protein
VKEDAAVIAGALAPDSMREYTEGEAVFTRGEAADAVFYIHLGVVALTIVAAGGELLVVGTRGPGNFFGEGCLADRPLRVSNASAVERSSISRVHKLVMAGLLQERPGFAAVFLGDVLQRNTHIESDLIQRMLAALES